MMLDQDLSAMWCYWNYSSSDLIPILFSHFARSEMKNYLHDTNCIWFMNYRIERSILQATILLQKSSIFE